MGQVVNVNFSKRRNLHSSEIKIAVGDRVLWHDFVTDGFFEASVDGIFVEGAGTPRVSFADIIAGKESQLRYVPWGDVERYSFRLRDRDGHSMWIAGELLVARMSPEDKTVRSPS